MMRMLRFRGTIGGANKVQFEARKFSSSSLEEGKQSKTLLIKPQLIFRSQLAQLRDSTSKEYEQEGRKLQASARPHQPLWRFISNFVQSLLFSTSVTAFQSQRKTRNYAHFFIMNLSASLQTSLNKVTCSRHLFLRCCYKACPFLWCLKFKISHCLKTHKEFSLFSMKYNSSVTMRGHARFRCA